MVAKISLLAVFEEKASIALSIRHGMLGSAETGPIPGLKRHEGVLYMCSARNPHAQARVRCAIAGKSKASFGISESAENSAGGR